MAYDQMIYVASGDNVQVYDNWMWNDPHGWGVQLYPDATNAHVYDNVIDHAGSGFVVGGSSAVAGNEIDHNIVLNSTGMPYYGGVAQGTGLDAVATEAVAVAADPPGNVSPSIRAEDLARVGHDSPLRGRR
jgi:hypothetical protein